MSGVHVSDTVISMYWCVAFRVLIQETKQVKVRAVPQRLSIWNVCQWKGVAQEHAFEVGVLEALRANRCFVAMVRAESEALDEVRACLAGSRIGA